MGIGVIVCGCTLGAGLVLLLIPGSGPRRTRLRGWFDEAGLAGVPLSIIAIVLATVGLIAGSIVSVMIPIPVIAPLGVVAGIGLPIVAVATARDVRRRRARASWPDVIDAMRISLRSGSTLMDSVASSVTMVPKDWRPAWSALASDLRRGADSDAALRRLQRELADPIADRVVESIIMAREFGGSELPLVLNELSRSVRREHAMRTEAQSRQSWVRHAATLGVASPWVVLAMLASRPENREAYASAGGTVLIVVAAGATTVAYAVMTALGTLRETRRWLTGALDE